MGVEAAVHVLLERLSDTQVEALAAAVAAHDRPPAALPGVAAGAFPGAQEAVTEALEAWQSTPGLTGTGLALALRTGTRLRHQAAERRNTPVWTGPQAAGDHRLTSSTLHGLLAQATERILLVSYAAHTLPEIADDLSAAVARGCVVDVVFETSGDGSGYEGPSTAFAAVDGLRRWRWPKEHRPPKAALHAKLLVVDGRRALIGSANLTNFALTRNLEAGLLVRDESVAADLEQHVRDLIASGVLCPA